MKRVRATTIPPVVLQSLAQLQDGLNAMIDPSWRKVRTLDNWSLAVTMESTELMDSYPWKWWKNLAGKADFDNVKIELVDILHFSLSGTMQLQCLDEERKKTIMSKHIDFIKPPACGKECKKMLDGVLYVPLEDTQNAIATFRNVIQLANACRFDTITEAVIMAADDLDFNMVAYYVAKHTLNCIRQSNGYKSGTYVKVNQGIEDNVLLHQCIKDFTVDDVLDENRHMSFFDNIMEKVYEVFNVPVTDRKNVQYWIDLSQK